MDVGAQTMNFLPRSFLNLPPEALVMRFALALIACFISVATARKFKWVCQNTVIGRKEYEQNHAEASLHSANGVGRSGNSLSSYPHEFANHPGFRFPRAECNNLKAGQYLLEFPLFSDDIYNKQTPPTKRRVSKNPKKAPEKKPEPGPARVIYLAGSKTFCGVISHVGEGGRASGGGFALCARE
ncbi:hypothetical protein AeMF1_020537 [Aphanomyces euteiches]|nr:hypothetical protein AeMF1_020537 [Aphanomyces euteiches]